MSQAAANPPIHEDGGQGAAENRHQYGHYSEESQDTIEIIGEVTTSERSRRDSSGQSSYEAGETGPAAPGPAIPAGSRPVGSQSAGVDFGPTLPDCSADRTAQTAQFDCWDPVTREALYFPPQPQDPTDEANNDQDNEDPPAVTGAQLSTAIREYSSTRINPAALIIQPDQNWHLVNLPVIVRTEPTTQDFTTTLLGLDVHIRAEPASYTWDFGDDTPVLNTTEIGAPYPNHTLEHTYTTSGNYQITLITYWSGAFRVQNGPWITIDGLGITTTTSPTLDLQTRTTRLTG